MSTEKLNIPVVNHRFHITLEDGQTILNVQKLSKRSEINEKIKLYYELGYYSDYKQSNWTRTGKYKEITNPIEFRNEDDRLDDPKYIAHHSFVFNGD